MLGRVICVYVWHLLACFPLFWVVQVFLFGFKKSKFLKIRSESLKVHVTDQNSFYVGVLLFFSVITIFEMCIKSTIPTM